MKANIFLILLFAGLFNFKSKDVSAYKVSSIFTVDSLPNKILIINSFDARSIKARKNKKELFAELADNLKQILYEKVIPQFATQAIIFPGLFQETVNSDSSIFSLMAANKATTAIIIKKLEVHFDQTDVEVTGPKKDKTRIASYNICADITYGSYSRKMKLKESEIRICEFYIKRIVTSGLFAAGPDVVGKKKDAFKIIAKNAQKYLWETVLEIKED